MSLTYPASAYSEAYVKYLPIKYPPKTVLEDPKYFGSQ